MIAAVKFEGALPDGPKVFNPGDHITDAEAKALGLASKPGLVTKEKGKGK